MPEMKRNFTKGKMNKDLDERLVPPGEYRDAMNIQVSTSDESDVGTVQNILGNFPGCTYNNAISPNPIPEYSTTVGSISDEKNDTLYWLVAGFSNINNYLPLNPGDNISFKDIIMRTNHSSVSGCEPVFVDKYSFVVYNESNSNAPTNTITLDNEDWYANITPGMTVSGYTNWGQNNAAELFTDVPIVHVGNMEIQGLQYESAQDTTPVATTTMHNAMVVLNNVTLFDPNAPLGLPSPFQNMNYYNYVYIVDQFYSGEDINNIIGDTFTLLPGTDNEQVFTIVSAANTSVTYTNTGLSQFVIKLTLDDYLDVWSPEIAQDYISPIDSLSGLGVASSYQGQPINATITSIDQVSLPPTSVITVSPNSSELLVDIYSALFDDNGDETGFSLKVKNSVGAGGVWPQDTCIDPTSVSSINDDEYQMVKCSDLTTLVLPYDYSNKALTFEIAGENAETVLNLADEVQLGFGGGALYFRNDRVLKFHPDRLITGINIVDDMLFWTDNYSEPKKINIPRSISGTDPHGDTHTMNVNSATGDLSPIKEEHVTVIRKGPKNALSIDLKSNRDSDKNYSGIITISSATNVADSDFWDQRGSPGPAPDASNPYDFSSITTEEGSNIFRTQIKSDLSENANFDLNTWKVGAKVVLKEFTDDTAPPIPIDDYTIKGTIIDWIYLGNDVNSFTSTEPSWGAKVAIKVDSISRLPEAADLNSTLNYAIDLFDEAERLFEFKLPRFSYRYKYEDGEYSTFGPWTKPAFLPGSFDYHPNQGYNLGMTNKITHLYLRDFINTDLPLDVVEIDLLYKEESSPSIYVVETIRPDSQATIPNEYGVKFNNWQLNEFLIDNENIKTILPSNQFLRAWDTVPKTALSQEITGNRIVYGNYKQNYDLQVNGSQYNPDFSSCKPVENTSSITSIKSLREYQLGVVFTDKHGRETPVISNNTGTFKVDKDQSSIANRLQLNIKNDSIPHDMEYYKFYIKETSGEYYNMAMDRYWDAEDGNMWVSFPSNDRDKIDIDSILILKKGVDADTPVKEPAKFKVLAIENEAPDFIKLNKTIISDVQHQGPSQQIPAQNIFLTGDNELPKAGENDFALAYWDGSNHVYSNTAIKNLHTQNSLEGDIYFQITNSTRTQSSKPIKIAKIDVTNDMWNQEGPNNGSFDSELVKWAIRLEEPFGNDINKFTNSNDGNGTAINDGNRAIFWNHKKENSAEFDGRFFVKIYKDTVFEKYIITPGAAEISNFNEDVTQKIYSFDKSKHSNAWGNLSNLNFPNGVNSRIATHDEQINNNPNWQDYITVTNNVGNHGNSGENWKSHAAFFRGINIHKSENSYLADDNSNPAFGIHGNNYKKSFGAMDLHMEGTGSEWDFEDVWFIDSEVSQGEHYGVWSENYTDQSHLGVGLNTDTKSIELGFGGIQPEGTNIANDWYWARDNSGFLESGDNDFYDLSNNDHYSQSANNLAKNLSPGKFFRWKNDPTGQVFKVNGSQQYNLLRHEADTDPNNTAQQYRAALGKNASGIDQVENGMTYITSTFFRPDNYSKNYKLTFVDHIDPTGDIKWDPSSPGAIDNGLHMTLLTDAANNSPSKPREIVVQSLIGTDVSGKGHGDRLVEVGMVITSIDGATDDSEGEPLEAVISKIEGNTLYLKHYNPDHLANVFPTANAAGDTIVVKQYGMNGLSRNSAKNINYFNEAVGFSDTNTGVDAVGYEIEILDPQVIESSFPRFPAIFETEPKESEALDVYYEITDNIPTFLNYNNIKSILPINQRFDILAVDSSVGDNGFLQDASYVLAHHPVGDKVVVDVDLTSSNIVSGDKLIVTKPNGDRVQIEIANHTSTVNNNFGYPQSPTRSIFELRRNLTNQIITSSWHNCYAFGNGVESNRIRDTFNQTYIHSGVKASTTLSKQYKEEHRKYGLIYSGLYNSISETNNLNQFIAAEKITKEINPVYGSIQKLYSRSTADGDLIALCEDRVLKILANKDAVYNADGNTNLVATDNVLGQAIPFSGEYGISKNPESFAAESYRVYFTDKVRGKILRLSKDGLTPISDYGMKIWFRNNLKLSPKLVGSYDDKKNEYNITLRGTVDKTVSFKEDVKGWVSFKSFLPQDGISCANEYYTFKQGNLWQHHSTKSIFINGGYITSRPNKFYGQIPPTASSLTVILNDAPNVVKAFHTLNYEGSQSRVLQSSSYNIHDVSSWDGNFENPGFSNITDNYSNNDYYNLESKTGWFVHEIKTNKEVGQIHEFIEKEGKWFNYIKGKQLTNNLGFFSTSFDNADSTFQGLGVLAGSNDFAYQGCTDNSANNYNPSATVDDGSCCYVGGCTDPTANNYLANACYDNGGCTYDVAGCTDPAYTGYDPNANVHDQSYCGNLITYGCMLSGLILGPNNTMINAYINYNISYTNPCNGLSGPPIPVLDCLNGEEGDNCCCDPAVVGCMDPLAINNTYNPSANVPDNTLCDYPIPGCIDPVAHNYSPTATVDDGSCLYTPGCTDPTAINYDPGANLDNGTCESFIYGCLSDVNACNYGGPGNTNNISPEVNTDDGSCQSNLGCMDITACNYDANANCDDGNCEYDSCQGCTDPLADNYVPAATVDDGSCYIAGCTDPVGTTNYNPNATQDDGSCIPCVYGCTDNNAINYNPAATCDDGSCIQPIPGCMDPNACDYNALANVNSWCNYLSCAGCTDPTASNYNATATIDDGNCIACIYGCMDPQAFNYDANASCEATATDPGSGECIAVVTGCTDPTADNWGGLAVNTDDGSCQYFGCTDSGASNYDSNANVDDGSCLYPGCTDPSACNFDPNMSPPANDDDGSCTYLFGCMDPAADNFDATAECSDGSCQYLGCTDPTALNYDASANTDDGSCIPYIYGCLDPAAFNYDPNANWACQGNNPGCDNTPGNECSGYPGGGGGVGGAMFGGCCEAVSYGCTDPTACNYIPGPNTDDGSCQYNYGCDDPTAINYDPTTCPDPSACEYQGCMDPSAQNYWNEATVPGPCLYETPYGLIEYSSFVYEDPTNGLSVDLSWSFASSADGGCDTAIMHYGNLGDIYASLNSTLAGGQQPNSPHTFDESHVGSPNNNTFVEGNEYEWRVKCQGDSWNAEGVGNNQPPYHPIHTFKFEVNPLATQSGAYMPAPVQALVLYTTQYLGEETAAVSGVDLELLLQQIGALPTFTSTGVFGGNNGTQWISITQASITNPALPNGANVVVKRDGLVVASTADGGGFYIGSNNYNNVIFPGVGALNIPNFDFQQGDIITIE